MRPETYRWLRRKGHKNEDKRLHVRFDPLKHQWYVWSLQALRNLTIMKLQDTLVTTKRDKVEVDNEHMVVSFLHEIISEVASDMFMTLKPQYPDEIWSPQMIILL